MFRRLIHVLTHNSRTACCEYGTPGRRWHQHADVTCSRCGKVIWPRVTCAREQERGCLVPEVAVCKECRGGQS